MEEQLPLDLSYRKAFNKADFIISPCNRDAILFLDGKNAWTEHALLILGATGSGKTHLAHTFSKYILSAAVLPEEMPETLPSDVVIEDIDTTTDEITLFHWYNYTKEKNCKLLMTANKIPEFKLADLKSRIGAIPKISILNPDEFLLKEVLKKSFSEMNILVDESVINYALIRLPRTFEAIHSFLKRADSLSLSTGRRITIPLIGKIL